MRRLICGLMLVALAYVSGGRLAGQSLEGLRRTYGDPVSETFMVRPGICVTATLGANGHVSEFLIAPEYTDLIKSRNSTLSLESVKGIIDELIPPSARGKYLMGGFVNARCLPEDDCNGTSENYEKLTVFYSAAPERRVHYAVVRFKE